MRLFLAIELPDDVRRHLARWGESHVPDVHDYLRSRQIDTRLSVTPPENLHVTLKFLGDVDESAVGRLRDALGGVRFEPATPLRAERVILLPERGPVRVLAAELDGDVGRLARLHGAVEGACEAAGFPPERRPYLPHVTLARARDPIPGERRERVREKTDLHFPGPDFAVDAFALFESQLGGGPPRYTRLARFQSA